MSKLAMLSGLVMVRLPETVLKLLYGQRPTYRGRSINPKALALGRLANTVRIPGELPSVAESREQSEQISEMFERKGPKLVRVENFMLAGADGQLQARLYSDSSDLMPLKPALVYFHGGGFVQGNLDTHNEVCAKLAKWSGGIVVSIDYRLAPEHPFPAGVDDSIAAFKWLASNAKTLGIDAHRMGVGGDSAGGCITAVVADELSSDDLPPCFQVLIYPVTDGHLTNASIDELAEAYVLPKERITWYRDLYRGAFENFSDPKFSPVFTRDFAALPKSYVVTGGFDPLVDDGTVYVEKLEKAGVPVTHRHFAGQIHAFVNLTSVIPQGTQALKEIAAWLSKNW